MSTNNNLSEFDHFQDSFKKQAEEWKKMIEDNNNARKMVNDDKEVDQGLILSDTDLTIAKFICTLYKINEQNHAFDQFKKSLTPDSTHEDILKNFTELLEKFR